MKHLGINEIKEILPHRHPFLLVDYIEDYEAFLKLCYQLNIQDEQSIQKYNHLKNKIEKGFSFIHEVLFHELTKKEYKKK